MPVDRAFLGQETAGSTLLISRSRLRLFAKVTAQTDPLYTDLEAARRAGHRDLPVPPTFFTAIDLEAPEPFGWVAAIGVDLRSLLHGEQRFVYHRMAYAGDELSTRTRISDIYERRGGQLEFVVRRTDVTDRDGRLVVEAFSTTVIRVLQLSQLSDSLIEEPLT